MSRRPSTATATIRVSDLPPPANNGVKDRVPLLLAEAERASEATAQCLATSTSSVYRQRCFGFGPLGASLVASAGVLTALFFIHLSLEGLAVHGTLKVSIHSGKIKLVATKLTPVQSQVVHRHGDRTPITPLADSEYWASLLPSDDRLAETGQYTNIIRTPGVKHHVAGGGNIFGRLTETGLEQMVRVGSILRDDVARLMTATNMQEKESADPNAWLKVASTDFSRTLQSVQGVLVGMLSQVENESLRAASHPRKINIDARHTNRMIPDPQPRLYVGQAQLEQELQLSEAFQEREQKMRPLATRVTWELKQSGILGKEAEGVVFGVGEDGSAPGDREGLRLPWNQLAEILKCLEKRQRLPRSLARDLNAVKDVAEHNAWRWFALLSDSRLGPMAIKSMAKKMVKNGSEAILSWTEGDGGDRRWTGAPLMHIFSGHDATLISLMCAFKIERPAVWPEYGSFLKMEVYRDDSGMCNSGAIDSCVIETGVSSDEGRFFVLFSLNGEALRSAFGAEQDALLRYFVPWEKVVEGMDGMEFGLPPLAV